MMRSLFSGVAGLKTHQTKMDVIGNNIANVNTTAYKSSSITFSDLMSQTTQNASGANATTGVGGTNAKQIGLGVKAGAINMNIDGQGSAQSTGNPFDIMITGDNFFIVNNGTENFFTRDGSFYVDGAGNLAMTSTGYNLMGWKVDPETNAIKQDTVSALQIMNTANMTYPAEATTQARVGGILDKNDTDVNSSSGKTVNLNLYDALGYQYTARLTMKTTDTDGAFSVELTKLLDSDGNEVDTGDVNLSSLFGAEQVIKKATNVSLSSAAEYDATNGIVTADGTKISLSSLVTAFSAATSAEGVTDYTATMQDEEGNTITLQRAVEVLANACNYGGSESEFLSLVASDGSTTMLDLLKGGTTTATTEVPSTDLAGVISQVAAGGGYQFAGNKIASSLLTMSTDNGSFISIGGGKSVTLELSKLGGNFEDITVDFSGITMYNNNGTSTVAATSGDENGVGAGRMLGDMIGVSVQKDGMIYASYDNGMTKLLGQIATAKFANASGLEKKGDNLYSSTLNSGEFDGIGVDVTAGGGYLSTGVLEMSNVDLSQEFTDMITTQRGFQANSRIITVSDTLLEELTNLKR
jgi:flagellar hook protein FlgE